MRYLIIPVVITLSLVMLWLVSGCPENGISSITIGSLSSVITSSVFALFKKEEKIL